MKLKRLWATDHRALVLESVATSPTPPGSTQIAADCVTPDFSRKNVQTMISTLRREGLLGLNQDRTHFLTKAGFDWLTNGYFDRALPRYAERPKSRKRKVKENDI